MPSPEELAREKIDALLTQCGWILQNRSTIDLSAGRGIAIQEALLKDRAEVDYLLFVDGKAIGTVEAKRAAIPYTNPACCRSKPLEVEDAAHPEQGHSSFRINN